MGGRERDGGRTEGWWGERGEVGMSGGGWEREG